MKNRLLVAGAAALGVALAGCGTARTAATLDRAAEPAMAATHASAPQPVSSVDVDAEHEAAIKAFPAKTKGTGNVPLQPQLENGIKVFEMTATATSWEVAPGQFADAFAYNGQIPGPQLRVRQGDRIRVVLRNELPESTSIHFHGLTVPNAMDGVTFITQPPVKPKTSFVYEFPIVDGPGTYMYHSHHNSTAQVGKGLFGSIVVEPAQRAWDVEHTLMLGDGALGYSLNGKGFPATQPIAVRRGQRLLVRFLNAGQQLHPMHMHGFHFTVVARDGRPTSPYVVDTLTVAPGERYDALVTADLPGVWAFHCHVLPHAESEHGMFGMVTAVIVT